MLNKIIIAFLIMLFSINSSSFAGGKRPRYQTNIRYNSPNWLSNERIICVKYLDHYKLYYGLLANISKGTAQLFKSETQIVSMSIDGTDEKIIKNIIMVIKDIDKATSSEKYFIGEIKKIDYNPIRRLIAFSELVDRLYLMNEDGTNLKKIAEPATRPEFSPNGRYLQYTSNYKVWLYDLDSKESKVLVENARGGPWSPDGKKIAISRKSKEKPWQYDAYIYDLETKKEELFGFVEEWSPTGKRITSSRLLRYPRISPDGTKIVGEPYSDPLRENGRINYIGICDIDDKNLKVLRYYAKDK